MNLTQTKTICLDLDGVIIDLVVPLMRWWGVHISSEDAYPRFFGWELKDAIADTLNRQNKHKESREVANMTKGAFWRAPPRQFWRDLKPYPTALNFIEFLESGPFDVYVATAHANGDCAAAKLDWIDEYLPKYWDRVLIGHPKHLMANPNSILIDDRTKNCEDFEEAGGIAVQCPRPWNKRWMKPECWNVSTGLRRPVYNVITQDLYAITGHVDTP